MNDSHIVPGKVLVQTWSAWSVLAGEDTIQRREEMPRSELNSAVCLWGGIVAIPLCYQGRGG